VSPDQHNENLFSLKCSFDKRPWFEFLLKYVQQYIEPKIQHLGPLDDDTEKKGTVKRDCVTSLEWAIQ
jgi:hypothetical protein